MNIFDIPQEITTKAKFWGKILVMDGAIMFFIVTYTLKLSNYAYSTLRIPTVIFCILMGVFWLLPSKQNKKKRNFHTLLYIILKRRITYHPISYESYDDETN